MAQIELKNIYKSYENGVDVLKNVSFSVEDGEFIFIVGPSGAGKSTILKILIREDIPSAGEVILNDQNISNLTKEELPELRRKIGVVFQDFKLLESKTVFENVAIALEVVNSTESVINSVVPNVLTMVGLLDKKHKFPEQLSGGEKQRASIARALAHEPDVLLADEPTGMIDPKAAEEVMDILEKINSMGTTVIMATHNQDIVNRLKKRVIKINAGEIVSDKKEGKYHD